MPLNKKSGPDVSPCITCEASDPIHFIKTEREDEQLLIQTPDKSEAAAALSTLTSDIITKIKRKNQLSSVWIFFSLSILILFLSFNSLIALIFLAANVNALFCSGVMGVIALSVMVYGLIG